MLAWAQTGSVHGHIEYHQAADQAIVRLAAVDHSEVFELQVDGAGNFNAPSVPPGWYILSALKLDVSETVRAVYIEPGRSADAGLLLPFTSPSLSGQCAGCVIHKPGPVRVLSVCEALLPKNQDYDPVVIVGIYKSGMDQTLRQDCPNQLMSGEVGWLSAIALSGSTEPPDQYRAEIEKKKAAIYASYPPEAKPRPERLVGLYGRLVKPEGLTSAPCCHAQVETTFAPARLIGIDEKDHRVIR